MPHPRFSKLAEPRQSNILVAAAKEFAAHGYADASINRILEQAGISKSVAYYYFESKEDLFLTVVQHGLAERWVGVEEVYQLIASLTADTFWPGVSDKFRRALLHSFDTGWPYGVIRTLRQLRYKQSDEAPLATFVRRYLGLLAKLVERGQTLGLIRTDVPDDQLIGWVQAMHDANDRWVLDHWSELDRQALEATSDRWVDGMRRLLSPYTLIDLRGADGY